MVHCTITHITTNIAVKSKGIRKGSLITRAVNVLLDIPLLDINVFNCSRFDDPIFKLATPLLERETKTTSKKVLVKPEARERPKFEKDWDPDEKIPVETNNFTVSCTEPNGGIACVKPEVKSEIDVCNVTGNESQWGEKCNQIGKETCTERHTGDHISKSDKDLRAKNEFSNMIHNIVSGSGVSQCETKVSGKKCPTVKELLERPLLNSITSNGAVSTSEEKKTSLSSPNHDQQIKDEENVDSAQETLARNVGVESHSMTLSQTVSNTNSSPLISQVPIPGLNTDLIGGLFPQLSAQQTNLLNNVSLPFPSLVTPQDMSQIDSVIQLQQLTMLQAFMQQCGFGLSQATSPLGGLSGLSPINQLSLPQGTSLNQIPILSPQLQIAQILGLSSGVDQNNLASPNLLNVMPTGANILSGVSNIEANGTNAIIPSEFNRTDLSTTCQDVEESVPKSTPCGGGSTDSCDSISTGECTEQAMDELVSDVCNILSETSKNANTQVTLSSSDRHTDETVTNMPDATPDSSQHKHVAPDDLMDTEAGTPLSEEIYDSESPVSTPTEPLPSVPGWFGKGLGMKKTKRKRLK